jgi:hypothetical protein
MPTIRLISREEAQQTRKPKALGVRKQRMTQFDEYVQFLLENPAEAVVFEELEEEGQRFVLSMRGALKRHGVQAMVRKMRGRDEVRVWLVDQAAPEPEPVAPAPTRRRRTAAG